MKKRNFQKGLNKRTFEYEKHCMISVLLMTIREREVKNPFIVDALKTNQ